jgi:hypothetical protein
MTPRRAARETTLTPSVPSCPDGVSAFRKAIERAGGTVTVLPDGVTWAIQYRTEQSQIINALIDENERIAL